MELNIQNKKIEFFNDFDVTLKYDSIGSVFSFSSFFEPEDAGHKLMFKPGQYYPCTVTHEGELLITGTLLSETFPSKKSRELVKLSGYSTPGVLEDSDIPTSMYPLQSDGISLKEIAQKLIQPFGITLSIEDGVGNLTIKLDKKIEKSCAKESQNIKSYLTELAISRHVILSHNAQGHLVFSHPKIKQDPILNFDFSQGTTPGTEMSLSFNGQGMHSNITVIRQADSEGGNAGEASIKNPFVNAFRTKVISQSSGDDNDTAEAAKSALSAELKSNIKLTITTDRWNPNGKILRPNNIITVINPELYLYSKTRWFIEEVSFKGNNKSTTAVLTCVLPEVYNNQTPVNIFQ